MARWQLAHGAKKRARCVYLLMVEKFEERFGSGATEIEAFETLHPGEMARLTEEAIDRFIDPTLGPRLRQERSKVYEALREIKNTVLLEHEAEIDDLKHRFNQIVRWATEFENDANLVWQDMAHDMDQLMKDVERPPLPAPHGAGEPARAHFRGVACHWAPWR